MLFYSVIKSNNNHKMQAVRHKRLFVKKRGEKLREQQIQSKITKYFKDNQIEYNKLIVMSKAGWPDVMAIKFDKTYFFEVKTPTGTLGKLQSVVIDRLNKNGEIAFVVRSYEEFLNIWEGLP